MQVQNHAYRTSGVVLRLSTRGGTGTHWNGFTIVWTFHTESVVVNARSTLHRPKIRSGLPSKCRFQCFRSCSSWPQVPRPQPGTTGLRQCMCAMVSISAERGQKPGPVNRLFGLQPSSEDSNLLKLATASSEMTYVLASPTWWCTGCSGAQGAGIIRSMQLSTVQPFAWTHVSPYLLRGAFRLHTVWLSFRGWPSPLASHTSRGCESLSSTPSSAPHKGMKDHSIIGARSG